MKSILHLPYSDLFGNRNFFARASKIVGGLKGADNGKRSRTGVNDTQQHDGSLTRLSSARSIHPASTPPCSGTLVSWNGFRFSSSNQQRCIVIDHTRRHWKIFSRGRRRTAITLMSKALPGIQILDLRIFLCLSSAE